MPIINVKTSADKSIELTDSIGSILLDLTTSILRKDPKVTVVTIQYVDPDDWLVAGTSIKSQGRVGVYFDIKITDETNTKAEKAQYIAKVYEAFNELLGNLHENSYFYVEDVRSSSYGYGGKTQEYRYQHANSMLVVK